jgi:hypothetical protein
VNLDIHRANKAQFSEVALRHIDENEVTDVAMPTVQGTDGDDGTFLVQGISL